MDTFKLIPFREYLEMDRLSFSGVRDIVLHSPYYYKQRLDRGDDEDSPSQGFGRLVHQLYLEPKLFQSQYAIFDGDRRGTKQWKVFEENCGGRDVVKASDYDKAMRCVESLHRCEALNAINDNALYELSALWDDPQTGVSCKGRIDMLSADALIDIKTTRHTNWSQFVDDLYRYIYHAQLAFYRTAVQLITESDSRRAYIAAVSTVEPHEVFVVELDNIALSDGDIWMRRAIEIYCDCAKSGQWGPKHPVIAHMPSWHQQRTENILQRDLS